MAHKNMSAPDRINFLLQYRLLSLGKAICAKLMRMFGRLHAFFQGVSERGAVPDLGKFVALFLCVPCFKASHFFFKLAYALNHSHLLCLCGEDFFLEFYDRRIANNRA